MKRERRKSWSGSQSYGTFLALNSRKAFFCN